VLVAGVNPRTDPWVGRMVRAAARAYVDRMTAAVDRPVGVDLGLPMRLGLRAVLALTDLLVGVVSFTVVTTMLVLSVALLPVFLIGLPLFVLTGRVARLFAAMERRRLALFVDTTISTPAAPLGRWRATLADAPTWRAVGYCLLRLPLSVLTFTLTVSSLGVSLALLSLPAWREHVPTRHADLWLVTVTSQRGAWIATLAGLAALGVTLLLIYVCGGLDKVAAQGMLGTSATELAQRVDELQTSRARYVDAAETERRRIERNLHDGAQQRLVALAMNLGRAKAKYDDDPDAARQLLDDAHRDAKQALTELRDLARGLRPAILTDRGLDAAVSGLAARSPVPVTVDMQVEPRCSPAIEAVAYFAIAEALANIAKHAAASSVQVMARRDGDRLRVSITDDGAGGAALRPGGGLAGLADRVAGVDGTLQVDSPAGGPTALRLELPCAS
jgi:signal transduction histidine kinase